MRGRGGSRLIIPAKDCLRPSITNFGYGYKGGNAMLPFVGLSLKTSIKSNQIFD